MNFETAIVNVGEKRGFSISLVVALAFAGVSVLSLAGCGGTATGGGTSGTGTGGGNPPPAAPQGIYKITINSSSDASAPSENPTFGGTSFGIAGPYQKIRGEAYGRLNPSDPHNAIITDIQLAPKDSDGMVEYSMDFYILKPVDLSKGNHKIFYEINNRGDKEFGGFNGSRGGNNPITAADAGTAFLMNQGYTIVWSGWDPSVPTTGNNLLRINVPIATNAGNSITGPDYEYLEVDNATTTSFTVPYSTTSTDTTQATLTVRSHLQDAPATIPASGWVWTSPTTIALNPAGTTFSQSAIYELVYTAKDPYVGGIGFAATRDMASFLRTASADSLGTPNPLAGDPQRIISWSLSQPARYMNDFVWLGFNQDLQNKQVFDGVFNWVGAGSGVDLNYRFGHPYPSERNREDHLYAEASFPFSYATLTDPFTGNVDGRDMRCTQSNTCPKIMNVNSANEYWVKAGSLLHTDLQGNDVPEPANVRNYLLSGLQHAFAAPANSAGICQQFGNTTDPNPALRALFVDLDQWLDGTMPPDSAVPRRSDGTAVLSDVTQSSPLGIGTVPQSSLNWPSIPNVLYTGVVTVRNLFNFGAQQTSNGILSVNPPQATGKYYPSFVSAVDSDGNEVAGIRLPPVLAPVATTAGWNLRSASLGGNDGCEASGSLIPFAPDATSRVAAGDPRPSLNARYGNHAGYVAAVTKAANALEAQRLLLPADVTEYIQDAAKPITVVNNPVYGSYVW